MCPNNLIKNNSLYNDTNATKKMQHHKIDLTIFVKENYFFEIERKDKISSRITEPITVLTILIGLIGASIKDIRYPFNTIEAMQIASFIVCIIYIAKSFYFFSKFVFGYKYKYIATTSNIIKYYDDLLQHKLANSDFDPESSLLEYLQKTYSEAAHKNAINNDKKSEYLYILNRNLLVLLFPTSMLGILYLMNNFFFK